MSNHKFKLGLTVFLERTSLNRDAAPGAYEVTRQLPREKRRVRVSDQKFGRAPCARRQGERVEKGMTGRGFQLAGSMI
jgi:hypothetical protein